MDDFTSFYIFLTVAAFFIVILVQLNGIKNQIKALNIFNINTTDKLTKILKQLNEEPKAEAKPNATTPKEPGSCTEHSSENLPQNAIAPMQPLVLAQPLEPMQEPIQQQPIDDTEPETILPNSPEVFATDASLKQPETHKALDAPRPKPAIEFSANQSKPNMGLKTTQGSKKRNYEKFIGENIFGKIGILIFVIGIGLFIKFSFETGLLSAEMRSGLCFLVGFGLLYFAQRTHKKYRAYSSVLAGGAFATFYITIAISYYLFNLFSLPLTFSLLVLTTFLMAVIAYFYNKRELAIISLIGGFLVPFMVYSINSDILLLSYMAILNVGMFVLSFVKKWKELPVIAMVCTYGVVGYFGFCYGSAQLFTSSSSSHIFTFVTIYYIIFLLPILYIIKDYNKSNKVLIGTIVANNFICLGFLLNLWDDIYSGTKITGLIPVVLAMANLLIILWLKRYYPTLKELINTIIALVVSLLTIAVPTQLTGINITMFWATEIVILVWLYSKTRVRIYEVGAFVLMVITALIFASILLEQQAFSSVDSIFINQQYISALYASLCYIVAAYLMFRNRELFDGGTKLLRYNPYNALLIIWGLSLFYLFTMSDFIIYTDYEPSGQIRMKYIILFNACYFALLSLLLQRRFLIKSVPMLYKLFMIVLVVVLYVNLFVYDATSSDYLNYLLTLICGGSIAHTAAKNYSKRGFTLPQAAVYTTFLSVVSDLFWINIWFQISERTTLSYGICFSIAMFTAALIQVILGMYLKLKALRIAGVVALGIVIAKLLLVDLWQMNSAGKIIVFVSLGLVLILLSFLYQKLKNVLFGNGDV